MPNAKKMPVDGKICCTSCNQWKPMDDFYPDRRRHTGRTLNCKACKREYDRHRELTLSPEYKRKRRERHLVAAKAYYKAIPPEERAQKHRQWWLKSNYRLSVEDFQTMLAGQGGGCAICGRPETEASGNHTLHVDHCHKTGKVRGLLCSACNHGLGRFDDSVDRLSSAILYLLRHMN